MKNYILDIIHLNNDFTGNGMYMAVYFFTLLFIAFFIKEKKYKEQILYPMLIIILGIYVLMPFVNNFVIKLFDDEVGGRLSWALMIPAVAALGCTLMVDSLKEEKKQLLLIFFLVPVIFACGVFQITDYRFEKAENLYKLPQALLDMSDDMLKEQRETGDNIVKLVVPYEIAHVFRQYSTDIELLFGEDATYGRIWLVEDERRDVCDTMQTTCPDLNLINSVADEYNMEYIVFDCVYTDFGKESLNTSGYEPDENFVGTRTPDQNVLAETEETVSIDESRNCWDLSFYGLEYVGTYGKYLLYKFV